MWGEIAGAVGSIAGGILGSKSSGPKIPKWLRQSTRQLGNFGQNLAQQPYQAYGGERVAGFSPDTLGAFNLIRQNVGTAQPYYAQALQTANRLQGTQITPQMVTAQQINGTNIDRYLNPYMENVVDASLADLENQRQVQYNGLASQAQAASAFGGSRFGVAQGQFEADALRNKALTAAQLRSQGFNTAAGLSMQEALANQDAVNRAMLANQSADLQGQLSTADIQNRNAFLGGITADRLLNANMMDAEAMGKAGGIQDERAQMGLDVGYNDYLDRTRVYPSQQMNWWSSALQPRMNLVGAQQPQTGGGLLGAIGGAQLGSQVGGGIGDWGQGLFDKWQNQRYGGVLGQMAAMGSQRVGG